MSEREKRKKPRVIVDYVSVEVYLPITNTIDSIIADICPICNLSESGMMFKSDNDFPSGKVIRLTFALPDSPIVIRTDAIVIHARKKRKLETGVQFTNLGLAEQKLLSHFIARLLVNAPSQRESPQ